MARRTKRGIKMRETDPASNVFHKCSPPSGTHRDSESWVEKRRGREETEATWWRKRRVQKRAVKPVLLNSSFVAVVPSLSGVRLFVIP